jgi:hypothetical protein
VFQACHCYCQLSAVWLSYWTLLVILCVEISWVMVCGRFGWSSGMKTERRWCPNKCEQFRFWMSRSCFFWAPIYFTLITVYTYYMCSSFCCFSACCASHFCQLLRVPGSRLAPACHGVSAKAGTTSWSTIPALECRSSWVGMGWQKWYKSKQKVWPVTARYLFFLSIVMFERGLGPFGLGQNHWTCLFLV